jgi:hypothetical protein
MHQWWHLETKCPHRKYVRINFLLNVLLLSSSSSSSCFRIVTLFGCTTGFLLISHPVIFIVVYVIPSKNYEETKQIQGKNPVEMVQTIFIWH